MRTITLYVLFIVMAFTVNQMVGQDGYQKKVEVLKERKADIAFQEKEALKQEVEAIIKQLSKGQITKEKADSLKIEAAEKRALNIENRNAIIDNEIALLKRNNGEVLELDTLNYVSRIELGLGGKDGADSDSRLFGVKYSNKKNRLKTKYDLRTYDDFVMAIGFNNAIIEGQSLNDSPYKVAGSRFFEIGWQWRTRVFKNSNFLRLNYGFSFQFNSLKPNDNQYFVALDNGQTELQEFDFELDKSKLRMDNLVFPVHLEFGPSKFNKSEERIRYSLRNQFRLGLGGYAGFNMGTRQKLKYNRNGENVKDKLKRGYNTNDLVYGLSAYAGVDGVLLYVKYDLNPIFNDAVVEQRNVSIGLRFDL